jgi:hypothetical protein
MVDFLDPNNSRILFEMTDHDFVDINSRILFEMTDHDFVDIKSSHIVLDSTGKYKDICWIPFVQKTFQNV